MIRMVMIIQRYSCRLTSGFQQSDEDWSDETCGITKNIPPNEGKDTLAPEVCEYDE